MSLAFQAPSLPTVLPRPVISLSILIEIVFVGGALFGLLGKKTNRHGRDIIVVFGYVVHMVCFFLIFINFPKSSPIESLDQPTYITSK